MFKFLTILAATTLLSYFFWSLPNMNFGNEPQLTNKIRSVSYSPFRRGQTPEAGVYPSKFEMESDIVLLSDTVSNIRIYSGSFAMGDIPGLAKKHGLTVWLGAWLDSNHETNQDEIAALIELANRYPQTITRVIVGNENIHRLDITVNQLREYLIQVKDSVEQPVSYADGWEYWLKHSEIVDAVDIITLHILPYWEQDPKPVNKLAKHIESILSKVAKRYPGKPLAIGEIGWPSHGRSRKSAVPGILEQARLIAEVHGLSDKMQLDYNIIEAFDQPWKARTEGTTGAYWGLFTADREQKYVRGIKAGQYPQWRQWFAISTAIAVVLALFMVLRTEDRTTRRLLGIAVIVHLQVNLIVLSCLYLSYVQVSRMSWVLILMQVCFTYLLLTAEPRKLSAQTANSTIRDSLSCIRNLFITSPSTQSAGVTQLYYLFTYIGIVMTWGLVLQPRYRDFPTLLFLLPVAGAWAAAIFRSASLTDLWPAVIRILSMKQDKASSSLKQRISMFREEAFAASCLCIGAILVVVREGTENLEATGFALTLVALASPYLGMLWLRK